MIVPRPRPSPEEFAHCDDREQVTVVSEPRRNDISRLALGDLESALLDAEARVIELTVERDGFMHVCAQQVAEHTDLRRRLANADTNSFRHSRGRRRRPLNAEGGDL